MVPFNPYLSRLLDAHINVEIITHSMSCIKYVIKYVTKGTDQAMYQVVDDAGDQIVDEISRYQNSRYLGAMEAAWRLQRHPVHEHTPPVEQLPVHLGDQERRVQFRGTANLDHVLRDMRDSKLTAFFKLCEEDEFAKTLLYTEVPKFYTWQNGTKRWQRRKRGVPHEDVPGVFRTETLGRMFTVSPRAGEAFFLRLLLNAVRGPSSHDDLRNVDGVVCDTFKEACSIRGLLDNGQHWQKTMEEAATCGFPRGLRNLFALIIVEGNASCDAMQLWLQHRESMSEDILHRRRQNGGPQHFTDEIFDEALKIIENRVQQASGHLLRDFGLPTPLGAMDADDAEDHHAEYDVREQHDVVTDREALLTAEQRAVYEEVMRRLDNNEGGIIFIQAPGGEFISYAC